MKKNEKEEEKEVEKEEEKEKGEYFAPWVTSNKTRKHKEQPPLHENVLL